VDGVTARSTRHFRVAAELSGRSDDELAGLVASARPLGVGVGGDAGVLDVDGAAVFVKRAPLTDRELARPRSTANLFGVPVHSGYGVAGPGINAWRELVAGETVTAAVLAGRAELFPLLHHWRVLPGRAPLAEEHADLEAAVAAMGPEPGIRERLVALAAAGQSIVYFTEYLPLDARTWLDEDPVGRAAGAERDFAAMVAGLTELRLLHLDAHFGNLRSDGERLYLADFGLATSPDFDLTPDETAWVAHNATHDAGYAAMRLVNWLVTRVCGVPVSPVEPPVERNAYVRKLAEGYVPAGVPAHVAAILARHAPAAARLNGFYWRLFDGELAAPYPLPDPSEAVREVGQ
jgi:hypothetical protein